MTEEDTARFGIPTSRQIARMNRDIGEATELGMGVYEGPSDIAFDPDFEMRTPYFEVHPETYARQLRAGEGRSREFWEKPAGTSWEQVRAGREVGAAQVEVGEVVEEEPQVLVTASSRDAVELDAAKMGGSFVFCKYYRDANDRVWLEWEWSGGVFGGPQLWSIYVEQYWREGGYTQYHWGHVVDGVQKNDRRELENRSTLQQGDTLYIELRDDTSMISHRVLDSQKLRLKYQESPDDDPIWDWFQRKDWFGIPNWGWLTLMTGVGVLGVGVAMAKQPKYVVIGE